MKKLGSIKKGVALLLALVLVFVAGCQAISGVDLNKAITNSLKVTSYEGEQTLSLQLNLSEEELEYMDEDELAIMKLINSAKLELTNIKVQDDTHVSYSGKLLLADTISIGFSLKMSDTTAVVEIEGAKQPFVLDMSEADLPSLMGISGAIGQSVTGGSADASLVELGKEVIDAVSGYFINNLPNPDQISVNAVQETINGQSVSLMKVHTELDGPAIWTWIKKYVGVLVSDRAGLDNMVKGFVEVLSSHPEVWEAIGEVNPFDQPVVLDGPTQEDTIKELADSLAEELAYLQEELQALEEEEDGYFLESVFNKNTSLKTDVYVDSKLDIRKQVVEATITLGDIEPESQMSIVIRSESQKWNVNEAVKADAPVVSENAIDLDDMYDLNGYETLQWFDKSSNAYDLLKNTFHVGVQTATLYTQDYGNPPIITPTNITLVPLRDVAEQLGATISYNKKTKQLTLFDKATDTTITVKNSSDTVIVNGKSVKWSYPATTVRGTVYVPARNLAKSLGASLKWESYYDTEKYLVIEREVG
ncbi:copper amine oxidase N-terminal domain-containing protein [Paenibacillus algorifonticola]|uniref:copper amine oxidase N-terminal domain-containing protein n=1 Tax=Paenibacillus algorifonticola TaxID=684063 RepID=UPI003D2C37CA